VTENTPAAIVDVDALLAAIEQLDAWAAAPGQHATAPVRVLEEVLNATGARGAYLDAEYPPLPSIAAGAGTLRRRPGSARRLGISAVDLRGAEETTGGVGTLFLDHPATGSRVVARVLAASLEAGRARAELSQSVERLDALDEAIRAMAAVLSVERVLQVIVDRVRELTGSAYAALGIVGADSTIEQFITSGISRVDRSRIGAPPRGHGILGLVIRENQSIRIDDLAADRRRAGFPAHHPEMHSFLGVPVSVHGRAIGNLYLADKATGFTDSDRRIVETFASHAAIAMENARLHEQVQRLAVVEERERIGRDLHDGVIQSIYAVGLSLEDVPEIMEEEPDEARRRVERAIESLDQTIRDIRNFIFGLRPQLLDGVGYIEGVAALADEFRVNTMVDVELRAVPDAALILGETQTLELLSITREALSNIARHAKASRAIIGIRPDPEIDGVQIEINDNGIGFDPALPRGLSHQGLRNMRSRAVGIGALLSIESQPEAGTRIIVRVPRGDASEGVGDVPGADPPEERTSS
jgi:signal transduction histidine kinase